jgi:hypothetical protein
MYPVDQHFTQPTSLMTPSPRQNGHDASTLRGALGSAICRLRVGFGRGAGGGAGSLAGSEPLSSSVANWNSTVFDFAGIMKTMRTCSR